MISETMVRFQRTGEAHSYFPRKGSSQSAGFDLFTQNAKDLWIDVFGTIKISSGIRIEIPSGYYGMVVPRSSAYLSGLDACGIVDSDYRGEIYICLRNVSDKRIVIAPYSRVVQLIIVPHLIAALYEVPTNEKLESTVRGDKGFGSSGEK